MEITEQGPSLLEFIGPYPLILVFLVILLIALTLIKRRLEFCELSKDLLIALGFLGMGATAWRIAHAYGFISSYGAAIDPDMVFLATIGHWIPAGIVLPTVGVALIINALVHHRCKNKIAKER